MIRFLFLFSFIVVTNVFAQEMVELTTGSLTRTLVNLKDSAESLSNTNTRIDQENKRLRDEITQLQLKLGQLKQQEDVLTQATLRLHEKNENKAKEIATAQQQLFNLDATVDHVTSDVKLAKENLAKLKQEENNFNEQINQIDQAAISSITDPVEDERDVNKRKEKINLLKMIEESHGRQEVLNQQLLNLKPSGPQVDVVELTGQREALQAQIEDAKKQLASLSQSAPAIETIEPQDVMLLARQMDALEKNYEQLKELWAKMQQKAEALKMNPEQKQEKDKLEKNIMDLNHDSQALKSQLHDLREQMVELDKRKTSLQNILNQ